jgi:methionine biosynthesis protein MetW
VSALLRLFRSTEDENRRVILETMPTRPGARMLDLGCADGQWTIEVARHVGAAQLYGVEMLDERAAEARGRGIEVTVADLSERLDAYDDASFDVIHSNQVIEHVRNTDCFMQEIRRLLRPDGYALVSTNNLSSWHNIVSLALGWQPMPCNVSDVVNVGNPLDLFSGCEHGCRGQTHLRVFTGRALTELAAHYGLRTVVQRAAGYYPFPVSIGRTLARLDRRHGAFLVHLYAPEASAGRRHEDTEPAARPI